jgi:hypothetical protein
MGSSRDLWDEEVEDVRTTCLPSSQMKGAAASIKPLYDDPMSKYLYPHGPLGAPNSNGDLSFTLNKINPSSEIAVMTPHGQVKINLDTGDLTVPHGIGREEAIRDFWLGFQENFRGADEAKYENEIASLKKDISYITQKADEYRNHANDVVKKSILKKITEKYGSEKFIMIKPADLIKMIEGA